MFYHYFDVYYVQLRLTAFTEEFYDDDDELKH